MRDYQDLQFNEIKDAVSSYCAFSLGRNIIQECEPHFERMLVERDLKRSREMLSMVVRFGSLPLGGITDISGALIEAQKDGTVSAQDLLEIAHHGYACESIVKYLKQSDVETHEINDLFDSLDYDLALSQEIERCIGPNGEVNDSASGKLKNLRKSLKAVESSITKVAASYIRNNSNHLTDTIATVRNDRTVVLAKNTSKNILGGLIHGESNSHQTVYLEPAELLAVNNERATVLSDIEEEIRRILFELSQRVKRVSAQYLANLYTLALLDSYNARSLWAKKYNGTVATLSDKLVLLGARHPLIDQKKVVSNNYHILPPKNMLLISGPNTGGKTVSLKIIGLFTVLTLSGLPVSCDEAEIPFFDGIYVDIGDAQSIEDDLSTFSAHVSHISDICNKVTENSLVILDEPGDGTDPKEGECLATAILDYLRGVKCMCAVTTHFSSLKTYGQKHPEILNASVEFDQEALKPTYRYLEGITGSSNAFEIASRIGLNQSIIDRARQLRISSRTKEESLVQQLEASIADVRLKQDLLNQEKMTIQNQQKELRHQMNLYQNQKDKLMEQAKKEAEDYLAEVTNEADEILRKLREESTGELHKAIAIKRELTKMNEVEEEVEEDNHVFVLHDYVGIRNTNQRGVIDSIDRKKAIVNVKGLKITAKLSDLKYLGEAPKEKKEKSSYHVDRPGSLSLELNLVGYHVDEALEELDYYLDQAILMRAPFVRIIHGFGTGALRQAIWDHCRNKKFIASLRYGDGSEGGTGATIIKFKGVK